MATAFLFLGPVPFIPLETNLSVIQGMVGLVGFGYALVMVSSFGRAQSAALNLGYVDDINTYIMISGKYINIFSKLFSLKQNKSGMIECHFYIYLGMWSASFYIGNFIGPTVSGFLVDAYGFEWTTIVFFGLYLFILTVDICELTYNFKKSNSGNEYEKLTDKRTEKSPLIQRSIENIS